MNIMLDLETADTAPTSAIISIGAVHFTDELSSHEFYVVIKPESAIKYGTMNMRTVQWWMGQCDEARKVWNEPEAVDLDIALMRFTDWVCSFKAKTKAFMWGNGADFDNVILGNAYTALGIKQPWEFRNNRCFRTLKGLFHNDVIKGLYDKYDRPMNSNETDNSIEVRHNALYDARLQARIAVDLFAIYRGYTA